MKTKITNSVLFKACKWLTDSEAVTCEGLDRMTSREIVDMYELHSALYTVEYHGRTNDFRWRGVSYAQALRCVALVVELGYRPFVQRDSDREWVTDQFDVPAWF